MVIFTFKSANEVWFQLECAPEQFVSRVTVTWHLFFCCHVFPVVSELGYLLLEHVVINDALGFCL